MIFLVVFLAATAAGLLVVGFATVVPSQSRMVRKRLAVLQTGAMSYRELQERRRRQVKRDRLETLLYHLGSRVGGEKSNQSGTRVWLTHAGYRHQHAVAIFTGVRVILASAGAILVLLASTVFGWATMQLAVFTAFAAVLGWMIPFLYVNRRLKKRQLSLMLALPDALDLMVVCVEAGLALNQALLRVAEEIDRVSPEMSDELTIVNLEIRAGTPRDEALRHFADRTGVEDIKSLVSMLLQTDRFGTSIADSLRIHADTLRTKRMQRAEEAAAKLSVKLLFPLLLFVFPAFFVVLIGPSFFIFREFFGTLG